MTEKQEKILHAALTLFAREGFTATSTSKVAKEAGVSEGLIFRHFENKQGLLLALLKEGEERMKTLLADVVLEPDPRTVITKTIQLPFMVNPSEYEFWRLQFKLKWEMEGYYNDKMEPLRLVLTNAFLKLGYQNPELEASLVELILDATSSAILKGQVKDMKALSDFLVSKYTV